MNTIKSIEDNGDGFTIKTDSEEVSLGIGMAQDCCEVFGYFMSQDDLSQFIGAELLNVEVVDNCLVTNELLPYACRMGDTMFVNIITNRGVLQFIAYNSHNGYYGHLAWAKRNDTVIKECYL